MSENPIGSNPNTIAIVNKLQEVIDALGGDSGSVVTNAGEFAVQEDGEALTAQQAIQTAAEAMFGPGAPVVDSYGHAAIAAGADTADQALIAAPGENKQIWVFGIQFTLDTGDGTVSFQDEDDTAVSGVMEFKQGSGMAQPPSGNFAMPLWKVPTNKALEVDTVTCGIKGSIQYAIGDVS